MIGPFWQVSVPPLLAAAFVLVGRYGERSGGRFGGAGAGPAAALLTVGLAVLRLAGNGRGPDGLAAGVRGGFWLDDPLGRTMLALAVLPWLAATGLETVRDGSGGFRNTRTIGHGVAAGGAALACLSAGMFPALLGLGCVLLAPDAGARRAGRRLVVPAGIVALAWLGAVMLSAAAGRAPGWVAGGGTDGAGAPAAAGTLLLGIAVIAAFCFAVGGGEPSPASAGVRRGMAGSAAACLMLRVAALPGGAPARRAELLLGCALLGWAVLRSWTLTARRNRRAAADDAALVLGAAAALGLAAADGNGMIVAALGLLSLGTAYPLVLFGNGTWKRRVAAAALAGMPPFAPFAALLSAAERGFAVATAVGVLLLGAVLTTGTALGRAERVGSPVVLPGPERPWTAACGLALLALLLLGGSLLPPDAASWLFRMAPVAPAVVR